jgi:hypothetical protein
MSGTSTTYFSLLVYLTTNNLLGYTALDSTLGYAEDLIMQGQFDSIFSSNEPTIRTLLNNLLISAIRTMNMSVVKAALSAGAYPEVRIGMSLALTRAAGTCNSELVQLLLDSGAKDPDGKALERAVICDDMSAVKILLKVGGTHAYAAGCALGHAIEKANAKICTLNFGC